ncbi:EexN family lipoprotein [Pantoea sp.]|uniref:EexN family lipoprotein n=1 Tax=Pantoea sp. TaxID=69393 RepID=UPI0039E36706
MKNYRLTLIALILCLLTGCDQHNVTWYDNHPDVRDETRHRCAKMSDERRKQDYECMSAGVSATKVQS